MKKINILTMAIGFGISVTSTIALFGGPNRGSPIASVFLGVMFMFGLYAALVVVFTRNAYRIFLLALLALGTLVGIWIGVPYMPEPGGLWLLLECFTGAFGTVLLLGAWVADRYS